MLWYGHLDNQHIPPRVLENKYLVDVLKDWEKIKTELFHKQVRNHTGPVT